MKVLFFALDYHAYTQSLRAEMEELGATVTYVDIQPRTFLFNVFRTALPADYEQYLKAHHANAIQASANTRYDKVIFLQAHQICMKNLARLREIQSSAEFILYNWDSLLNHDYREQATLFDHVLTFDEQDAADHGYGYLPLFCVRPLQKLRRDRAQPQTVFTVGNIVKTERYQAIQAFREHAVSSSIRFQEYLKISPVVYARCLRAGIYPKNVHLRSIDTGRFCDMVESSIATFDYANHAQTGQTMRLIEALCTGKKIVTNNLSVRKEPFFSADRIHTFEGLEFEGIRKFLDIPIVEDGKDFSEYYIQTFTKRLLGLVPLTNVRGRA